MQRFAPEMLWQFQRNSEEPPTAPSKKRLDNVRYNDYIARVAKGIQAEIQQTKPFNTLEDEALCPCSVRRTSYWAALATC